MANENPKNESDQWFWLLIVCLSPLVLIAMLAALTPMRIETMRIEKREPEKSVVTGHICEQVKVLRWPGWKCAKLDHDDLWNRRYAEK